MLKSLGLPLLALAAMLTFASPKPAEAKVHFGVVIGSPPVYPYYQYCSPYDPYCSPFPYSYPYAYGYRYPYYQPYVFGGWGHRGHEFHEREFHEHHEFRGHHGGGEHHGGERH